MSQERFGHDGLDEVAATLQELRAPTSRARGKKERGPGSLVDIAV